MSRDPGAGVRVTSVGIRRRSRQATIAFMGDMVGGTGKT